MSEMANLLDELKRIHEADAWHGRSLKEILSGLTAEQVASKPVAGNHTIWELVRHIAEWEDVFCERLQGYAMDAPVEGDWPPVRATDSDAWKTTLARLDETHNRVIKITSALTDLDLQKKVPGKEYTIGFMLHGLVRHNVYHAGQIGLLKTAL